jgi:hypothetical protein
VSDKNSFTARLSGKGADAELITVWIRHRDTSADKPFGVLAAAEVVDLPDGVVHVVDSEVQVHSILGHLRFRDLLKYEHDVIGEEANGQVVSVASRRSGLDAKEGTPECRRAVKVAYINNYGWLTHNRRCLHGWAKLQRDMVRPVAWGGHVPRRRSRQSSSATSPRSAVLLAQSTQPAARRVGACNFCGWLQKAVDMCRRLGREPLVRLQPAVACWCGMDAAP